MAEGRIVRKAEIVLAPGCEWRRQSGMDNVLEALPVEDRRTVWEQVGPDQAGLVFVEVSPAVRESLVDATPHEDLVRLLVMLDPEDLAYALKRAGLSRDEDLFAPLWDSARNRWPWLAINLVTAFVASRVIGQFEGAIQALAPLAALMPIVASIGGNTGNQTMALVIRALATDRMQPVGMQRLMTKELAVSLMNGGVWGLIVGLSAVALYANVALGVVMSSAVVLNLVIAGLAGVAIPIVLHATGRDPFLGLASVFLL